MRTNEPSQRRFVLTGTPVLRTRQYLVSRARQAWPSSRDAAGYPWAQLLKGGLCVGLIALATYLVILPIVETLVILATRQ